MSTYPEDKDATRWYLCTSLSGEEMAKLREAVRVFREETGHDELADALEGNLDVAVAVAWNEGAP